MPPIKQWVNLDRNAPEILRTVPGESPSVIPPERCGPGLTLEATISETESGTRLSGRPIWWGVELGENNVSDMSGNPGWANRMDAGGFGGAAGLYEILSTTGHNDDRDAVAIAKFVVPGCGGDTFEFKAYTKDAEGNIETEIKAETYEVWRQLYYQVTRMGSNDERPEVPDLDWSQVEAEFLRDGRNIRWSRVYGSQELITHINPLFRSEDQWDLAREGYDRSREPVVVKVCLVDTICGQDREDVTFDANPVRRGQDPIRGSIRGILFDVGSPNDRDDWLYHFSAEEAGDPGSSITVNPDDLRKINSNTIEYTPPDNLPRCTSARIRLIVRVFGGSILGLNEHNAIWIAGFEIDRDVGADGNIQYTAVDSDMRIRAAIHEFGHALGLVNPGTRFYYLDGPHVGKHCLHPVSDYRGSFLIQHSPDCVMFGRITRTGVESEFCSHCADQVRAPIPLNNETFTLETPIPQSGRPAPPP